MYKSKKSHLWALQSLKIVTSLVFILLLSSCVFSPKTYYPVSYYDLGTPEVINSNGPYVKFLKFSVNGPYKSKMVFRSNGNKMIIDDYNKWVQPVSIMLKRYMTLAFRAQPSKSKNITNSLELSILSFEADELTKNAVVIVEYKITNLKSKKEQMVVKNYNLKMLNVKAYDFVQAITQISAKLAEELKSDILAFE